MKTLLFLQPHTATFSEAPSGTTTPSTALAGTAGSAPDIAPPLIVPQAGPGFDRDIATMTPAQIREWNVMTPDDAEERSGASSATDDAPHSRATIERSPSKLQDKMDLELTSSAGTESDESGDPGPDASHRAKLRDRIVMFELEIDKLKDEALQNESS